MHRRELLGSLAALSAFAGTGGVNAQQPDSAPWVPAQYESFDSWLHAARAASMQFLDTPAGRTPDYLIRFLALWGAALPRDANGWSTPWVELPGANARVEFNMLAAGRPFVVSAFRMAPGCLLPAHCHPGGGGVTMCLQGAVQLEHFHLEADSADFRDTGGKAKVRYESVTHLTPQRYTLFTPTAANLHQLRAGPDGAVGVDLLVQWEGAGEFSYFKFASDPALERAAPGQRFTGTWAGMNITDAYG